MFHVRQILFAKIVTGLLAGKDTGNYAQRRWLIITSDNFYFSVQLSFNVLSGNSIFITGFPLPSPSHVKYQISRLVKMNRGYLPTDSISYSNVIFN